MLFEFVNLLKNKKNEKILDEKVFLYYNIVKLMIGYDRKKVRACNTESCR